MDIPSKKVIGVIGGMGPIASLVFHELLLQKCAQLHDIQKDQDYPNIIHFSLANQISSRSQFLLNENIENKASPENPAYAVISHLDALESMAQSQDWEVLAVIVCNSFHAPSIYRLVTHHIKTNRIQRVKLLHLIKETVNYTAEVCQTNETIGILSTQAEWRHKLYKKELEKVNLLGLHPSGTLQRTLNDVIFSPPHGIKITLTFSKEFFYALSKIILNLKERGANKIILGCTELSLIKHLFDQRNVTFIDPLEVVSDLVLSWYYS